MNQYSLDIHISRVHEKVKPHLCSLCGKSFPSTSTLKKHIDAVHEKKEYECEECKEIFKNKYAYQMHLDFKHRGKESWKCKICNAELLTKPVHKKCICSSI